MRYKRLYYDIIRIDVRKRYLKFFINPLPKSQRSSQ